MSLTIRFWLGVFAVIVCVGCGSKVEEVTVDDQPYLPPEETPWVDEVEEPGAPVSAPEQADFVVSDIELGREFAQDADAATEKYEGKWIEVTGKFLRPGSNYVLLYGSQFEPEDNAVIQFYFDGGAGNSAMNSSQTRTIVLLGRFDEFTSGSVLLSHGVVKSMEEDPHPPIPVQAAQVTADFLAGKGDDYDSGLITRYLIEGTVLEHRNETVLLEGTTEGDETLHLSCYYGFDNHTLDNVKPGDKVKIIGTGLDRFDSDKFGDVVSTNMCRLWLE